MQVCKPFFLTTLGYKHNNTNAMRNALKGMNTITLEPEKGKKGMERNKEAIEERTAAIKAHVELFHPCVSHYRGEHAPNRRYLPQELNITDMHKHFINSNVKYVECKYETYRLVFDSMNIKFTKLGHEECDNCEIFFNHNDNHSYENLADDCGVCMKYKIHIDKAKKARELYESHAIAASSNPEGIAFYTADLEKVIMLPRMEQFKLVMFTRRICAYNESFVPLASLRGQNKPIAAIWHEAVSGRKKEEIISTYYEFFLQCRDYKNIILWLDNCSAQNKNWALLTFLIYIINSQEIECKQIDLYYFEPGHTYMAADSFHKLVEKSMKKKKNVYDFQDFKNCVQDASSNVEVIEMTPNKFKMWKDFKSKAKLDKIPNKPDLKDIKHFQAEKGSFKLKYSLSYDEKEPLIDLDFLQLKISKSGFPEVNTQSGFKGIFKKKKEGIISNLLKLMPKTRQHFWKNLPESDKDAEKDSDESISQDE